MSEGGRGLTFSSYFVYSLVEICLHTGSFPGSQEVPEKFVLWVSGWWWLGVGVERESIVRLWPRPSQTIVSTTLG